MDRCMNPTLSLLTTIDLPKRKLQEAEQHVAELPLDALEFATIDGGVVDYQACEEAVSNGAGIFIGGYFVGVTEFSQCYAQQSFMRK